MKMTEQWNVVVTILPKELEGRVDGRRSPLSDRRKALWMLNDEGRAVANAVA